MQSGVLLLIMAMCLTPGVDFIAKELTTEHSPFTVAFFRYLSAGVIALAIARATGHTVQIPKEARLGQFGRALLLVGSMTCLIMAFSMVPLAYAVGGFLISPIIAVLLCVTFLGERLTPIRAIGVAFSLIGAVVISKPAAGIELGSILALAGGVLLGTYLALTRGASGAGGALSALVVQCFTGAAVLAPLAFLSGIPQFSAGLLLSICGLGVFSAGAHFLTVAAYEKADASVLSPFMYFNLITAMVVGYVFWGEVPSGLAMFGLSAIALGGLVTMVPQLPMARLVLAPVPLRQ